MKKYKITKEDLLLEQQEEELKEGDDYEYDTRKESGEYDYLWEELDKINFD